MLQWPNTGLPQDTSVASTGLSLALIGVIVLSSIAEPAAAAEQGSQHTHVTSLFDVAEGEEFWSNVARYGRFFVTVMLGTVNVMLRPFGRLFKNPITGAVGIVGAVGAFYFIKFTVEAMLGVQEPLNYTPGTFYDAY